MKKRGMPLPNEDHVMRHVPWARLRKDENENVIGFLGQAFELRPGEQELSVNWLEYFDGDQDRRIRESVKLLRTTKNIGAKSAYAIGNVEKIKRTCGESGAQIRIVYAPGKNNPAHAEIRRLPRGDADLLEALAADAFTDLVRNALI